MQTGQVFVSHTSDMARFPAGRSFVQAALDGVSRAGLAAVDMRYFPASEGTPSEYCRARVAGCEVYVAIVGFRYGSLVPGAGVSYTEMEFEAASSAGLPRLVFLLEDGRRPGRAGQRAGAFRQRLREAGLVVRTFSTSDGLELEVFHALSELASSRALGRGEGLPAEPLVPGTYALLSDVSSFARGDDELRRPGGLPRVWNVPSRNAGFTGRDGLLAVVRERLLGGGRAVVQALHGIGGVGKTQLAIEYAHRFAGTYDLAWWINAEQPALIGGQAAALGATLGCAEPGADIEAVRTAVLAELRIRGGGWLLVFDNAENPDDVGGWLPGGGGHVLITSRARNWAETASPVEVDVLTRAESVALLQDRVPGLGEDDADRLAEQLGDLPLALAQAAGFIAGAGLTATGYLDLLQARAGQVLDQGLPESYPQSLAAATQLAAARLARDDPAADELASVCAFLAPEAIPEDLFTGATAELPEVLAARAGDPLAWRQTLIRLGRSALARVDQRGIQMHRLTQAILRDRLPPGQPAVVRARAEAILAAGNPGDPQDPATWPRWAQVLPHLLTAELVATTSLGLRELACNAALYLLERGDTYSGHDLASRLHREWSMRLGDDDPHTLTSACLLAWALRDMGQYAEARDLDQDTLNRRRRVLGDNHPHTLESAASLAISLWLLGEMRAARDLNQDILDRRRRILGADHPDTLESANNLASDLRGLGEVHTARDLDQDTLDRCRRILGDDHPHTLVSASNLAIDLRALGEVGAARDLHQDTLDRRRRILGDDHPDILASASSLAVDLHALGEVSTARDLHQDILDRRRRILGADHPDTLETANNLASDLRGLGEVGAARDLDQDTLDRRRRILGADHPHTLTSANNLASDLRGLGEVGAARDLDQDTLDRRRRILGDDHPHTLTSVNNLANDLRAPGAAYGDT